MSTVVIGTFAESRQAEEAVRELQEEGFDEEQISIVARDMEGGNGGGGDNQVTADVGEGVSWGGALGGIAGLMAGVGALAIPGIGPIIAAGPLAATLSGAVTGGVVGGLVDLGIPEESGREFEQKVREGRILAVVEVDDQDDVDLSAEILRDNGADDVETHES